jgi:hypothetical protein
VDSTMPATQKRQPLLTVGIPVHNAMPFLPEAIESILGQSFREFQLLVILDGCTDGSLAWLRTVHDPRLHLIEQDHRGLTSTLNRMLTECSTPWLVRQDADDIALPHRLECLVAAIASHPHAGMFYSQAAYHPQGKALGRFRSTQGTPQQIRQLAQSGYVPSICHPTVTLHVARTLAISGYRPGIQCEDADLWWRMALAYEVHCLPEVLLHFRQNAGSLTSLNLEAQAVHGLYVQYLLLSQLQKRVPLPLVQVEHTLRLLLPKGLLTAKEHLRQCNIALGQGRRVFALRKLAAGLFASPTYILGRIRDELATPSIISNGIHPRLYQMKEDLLWPVQTQRYAL